MKKTAVLAFSGGMDSTVLLHMVVEQGYHVIHTLSFNYGQRHKRELECVGLQIAELERMYPKVTITNKVIDVGYIIDIAPTSSLTNLDIENPKINEMAGDAQPTSYVPFRNMMFLSICFSYAEAVKASTVFYGAAQVDSLAGYWDGDQHFVDAMQNVASLNRKNTITLEAPLLLLSKKEIIEEGVRLKVNFANTWTCYSVREDRLADATTPSSSLRLKGFIDAQYKDPIKYIQQSKIDEMYTDRGCRDIEFQ